MVISASLLHYSLAQQTQNMCITFVQCWTNVEDVGPMLYKCYTNGLCLLDGQGTTFHTVGEFFNTWKPFCYELSIPVDP